MPSAEADSQGWRHWDPGLTSGANLLRRCATFFRCVTFCRGAAFWSLRGSAGCVGAASAIKVTSQTTLQMQVASHVKASSPLAQVTNMLWTIFAILLILWLLGWSFHIAGSLIHILLVIAIVVAVINLITGRRTV